MGRAWRAGLIVVVVALAAACGVQSPEEQKERERKAAGLSAFRIVCVQDLWDRTGGKDGRGETQAGTIPARISKRDDGLVTVELTGPNMVDLLRYLDAEAHPGGWPKKPDPLAIRMYEAIAPRIDAIKATPKADEPPPEVTIDDSVGAGTPSPTTTPSSSG